MLKNIVKLIDDSMTSYNACFNIEKQLLVNGYEELDFTKKVERNKKYYFKKNNSSICAFNIGKNLDKPSLNIVSSHLDVPGLKIKQDPVIKQNSYVKLNIETYGGLIMSTWLDRDLAIAGRVAYEKEDGISYKIVDLKESSLIIPNLAIHLNREINKGYAFNPKDDLLPIISLNEKFDFYEYLKEKCEIKEDILYYDLYLYPKEKSSIWGEEKEFITSYHLDNMAMAASSLYAFLNTSLEDNINVFVSFDNEEIGSMTKQGADSNFFYEVLKYISESLGISYLALVENGLNLSADNAHALHPNKPHLHDESNRAYINKGLVIKDSARQSYASDSISSALFIKILKNSNLPYQFFSNRSDIIGGSTLGNISNTHVSIDTVDIGLAQLAMHSLRETAGLKDLEYAYESFLAFYKTHINKGKDKISLSFK